MSNPVTGPSVTTFRKTPRRGDTLNYVWDEPVNAPGIEAVGMVSFYGDVTLAANSRHLLQKGGTTWTDASAGNAQHKLIGLDGNKLELFGDDGHLIPLPQLPLFIRGKQIDFRPHALGNLNADSVAAHGAQIDVVGSPSGASIALALVNQRSVIQINTGTVTNTGYMISFPRCLVTKYNIECFDILYSMTGSLTQAVEFGFWDSTVSNGIFCQRNEGATPLNLDFRTASGGSTTVTQLGVGSGTNRHRVRIWRETSQSYQCLVETDGGELLLKATNTFNISADTLFPFVRMRNANVGTSNKTINIEHILVTVSP